MKRALVFALAACGDPTTTTPDAADGTLTITNCPTTIAADVPEPYRSLFRCVDLSIASGSLAITVTGLPPHPSYYYGAGNPNYVAWDDRGGAYHPNPNKLAASAVTITIPLAPVAKGVTIDTSLVDGQANNPSMEYRGGPAGIATDSVFLFDALAAPGDDIAAEQYTFDPYNAHPAPGGQYHYHRTAPGPYEVVSEVMGLMCDGTFVLGCTELDGATPDENSLDAQNGHVHDVGTLAARYHVHLCPAWTAHPRPYTPEIQYYTTCTVR